MQVLHRKQIISFTKNSELADIERLKHGRVAENSGLTASVPWCTSVAFSMSCAERRADFKKFKKMVQTWTISKCVRADSEQNFLRADFCNELAFGSPSQLSPSLMSKICDGRSNWPNPSRWVRTNPRPWAKMAGQGQDWIPTHCLDCYKHSKLLKPTISKCVRADSEQNFLRADFCNELAFGSPSQLSPSLMSKICDGRSNWPNPSRWGRAGKSEPIQGLEPKWPAKARIEFPPTV